MHKHKTGFLNMNPPNPILQDKKNYILYKTRVASNFSKAATTYDQTTHLQQLIAEKMHRQSLLMPQSAYLLDLGSGTGRETEKLSHKYSGTTIIGLDIAEGMSKYAANQYPNDSLKWCTSDMEALPFIDNSFHGVFSNLTVQWGKLDVVLAEIYRVLKPNGHFLFSTLLSGTMKELSKAWEQVNSFKHVNSFHTHEEFQYHIKQSDFFQKTHQQFSIPIHYPDLLTLLHHLKHSGFTSVLPAQKGLSTPRHFKKLLNAYKPSLTQETIKLTYKVALVLLEKK